MLVRDVLSIMQTLAPADLAMDWDNPGLQVGSANQEVKKIAVCLDATIETVQKAVDAGCDLLLTHHPLFFKPLKKIDFLSTEGRIIQAAFKNGLSIAAAHTNWDAAYQGMASALADLLELQEQRPMQISERSLYKLVVFVPEGHEEKIREALFHIGAGTIGAYTGTYYESHGEGGFQASDHSSPFIGAPGKASRVKETRLEIIVPAHLKEDAALSVLSCHPYEEPAFDFYPVKVHSRGQGFGIWGRLKEGRNILEDCAKVCLGGVKWAGPKPGNVRSIALLPGSGASYWPLAKSLGAEVLLTGDASYHQALDAAANGLTLIDIGHFESEWPGVQRLERQLTARLEASQEKVACVLIPQSKVWNYGINT